MRALALALLLVASTGSAQVYKWLDADGVTHYSNQPPPAGAKEVGDRMNLYQPDAPLSDAIGTARVERRMKPPEPDSDPMPKDEAQRDASGGAGGPHLVQRPGPTWHSSTNIGYPSANNPGTRAAPPR